MRSDVDLSSNRIQSWTNRVLASILHSNTSLLGVCVCIRCKNHPLLSQAAKKTPRTHNGQTWFWQNRRSSTVLKKTQYPQRGVLRLDLISYKHCTGKYSTDQVPWTPQKEETPKIKPKTVTLPRCTAVHLNESLYSALTSLHLFFLFIFTITFGLGG